MKRETKVRQALKVLVDPQERKVALAAMASSVSVVIGVPLALQDLLVIEDPEVHKDPLVLRAEQDLVEKNRRVNLEMPVKLGFGVLRVGGR